MKMNLPKKVKDNIGSSIQVITGLIPYAGGSISTVLSNYCNNKKFAKIEATLTLLANKIKNHEIKVEKILTEDEVVEVIENLLPKIGVTSNDEKVKYLKNAFINSFTKDDLSYQQKELFIKVLEELTVIDIRLLKYIYDGYDPFTERIYPYEKEYSPIGRQVYIPPNKVYIEGPIKYMKSDMNLKERIIENMDDISSSHIISSISRLDSRALTNINSNLERTDFRRIKMEPSNISSVLRYNETSNIKAEINISNIEKKSSPIEASRTDFGLEFLRFVQSS